MLVAYRGALALSGSTRSLTDLLEAVVKLKSGGESCRRAPVSVSIHEEFAIALAFAGRSRADSSIHGRSATLDCCQAA